MINPDAPTNSEPEKPSEENEEEQKSEEYLNFESFAKAVLSIPPKEAEEIRKRTPYPKEKQPPQDS
jgi:hypothetical protein